MITVLPVNNAEELEAIYNQYHMPLNVNSGATVARAGDDVLGCCLFDIDTEKIVITALEPVNDIMLADGILRSALHIADYRGISEAYYSDTAPLDLLCTLDFIKNREEKSLKIEKLHESACNCKKNNK